VHDEAKIFGTITPGGDCSGDYILDGVFVPDAEEAEEDEEKQSDLKQSEAVSTVRQEKVSKIKIEAEIPL